MNERLISSHLIAYLCFELRVETSTSSSIGHCSAARFGGLMANAVSFTCVSGKCPISRPSAKPLLIITPKPHLLLQTQLPPARHSLKVKATGSGNQRTKPNSIVCADCDGNGAILCTQCKGTGVNSVDHFNGRFKAGQLCWLCRGKRDILCGSCNGAGFLGGFVSSMED